MKVKDLILKLKEMNQENDVLLLQYELHEIYCVFESEKCEGGTIIFSRVPEFVIE